MPFVHVAGRHRPVGTRERARLAGAFAHHNFRMLWLAETISRLGSSLSTLAIPLVAVTVLHADAVHVSVLSAMTWLPWLVVGLPAGAWVDRLPHRPVMMVCNVLSAVSFGSVASSALCRTLTVGQLMAAALVAGTATVFFETAFQAYLPALVPSEDLTDGNAKLQASSAGAGVVGPGLAGLTAQGLGAAFALVADALSFLMSIVFLATIRRVDVAPRQRREAAGLSREIAEGFRFVTRDPYFRSFMMYGAAANLALGGYSAILLVYMVQDLAVSPSAVGILTSLFSLAGVAGAACARRLSERFGSARALLLAQCCAPFALLVALAGPGTRLWLLVLGEVARTFGVMVGNVIKGAFRGEYCPPEMLGRVSVSMQFLNYGTIPLGALAAGGLSTVLGLRGTVGVMTSIFALSGIVLLAGPIRHVRVLPRAPAIQDTRTSSTASVLLP